MLYGIDDETKPYVLQEYSPTSNEINEAAFLNTWTDNPTVKLMDYDEAYFGVDDALAHRGLAPVKQKAPKISREELTERALKDKVVIKNMPEDGMTERAYEILAKRQRDARDRADVFKTGDVGFFRSAPFALVAGFLDPINVGADVAMGVGLSTLTKFGGAARAGIEAAEGMGRRALLRARIGAAEGVLGAAAVEPMSYGLSQELGDDYGAFDSMQNIAFGAIFGGGLHMAGGAIADAFSKGKIPEPQGKISQQIDKAPLKIKQKYAHWAVMSGLNESKIDVSHIRQFEIADASKRLKEIDAELARHSTTKAYSRGKYKNKKAKRARLEKEKADILVRMEENTTEVQNEISIFKEEQKETLDRTKFEALKKSEVKKEVKRRVAEAVKQGDRVQFKQDGEVKRITEVDGDTFITEDGEKIPAKRVVQEITKDTVKDAIGKVERGEIDVTPRKETPSTPKGDAQSKLDPTPRKDDIYIDEKVEQALDEELAAAPDDQKIEVIDEQVARAEEELREIADAEGLDMKEAMEVANEFIRKADEDGKLLNALAKCMSVRG